MKTIPLDIEYDYDFDVLAIVSSAAEHKIAWEINKLLNIDLKKEKDIKLEVKPDTVLSIANFFYETEHTGLRLFKNKAYDSAVSKPYLIPELKEYDYFLKAEGEPLGLNADELSEKIRQAEAVQFITPVDVLKLKSRENLLI